MGAIRTFQFMGLTFNVGAMISITVVAAVVFIFMLVCSRHLQMKPTGKQNLLEYMVDFTNGILKSTIGNDSVKDYGLWAFTLFYFILIANLIGLFAHVQVGDITYMKSPTADPIVALTFSLMSLAFAQYSGTKKLGYVGHFKSFLQPTWLFLPINLMEEMTNFLTLGIRVYGNIFAGELLAGLIAQLAFSHGIIVFGFAAIFELLWEGFSVFIGCIQAYVFVTLSSVYVSQKLTIEE